MSHYTFTEEVTAIRRGDVEITALAIRPNSALVDALRCGLLTSDDLVAAGLDIARREKIERLAGLFGSRPEMKFHRVACFEAEMVRLLRDGVLCGPPREFDAAIERCRECGGEEEAAVMQSVCERLKTEYPDWQQRYEQAWGARMEAMARKHI